MKRFWLFFGDTYYPNGGMDDFRGDFDTEPEARAYLDEVVAKGRTYDEEAGYTDVDWAHIYDTLWQKKIEFEPYY